MLSAISAVMVGGAKTITVLSISTIQAFGMGLITATTGIMALEFIVNQSDTEPDIQNTHQKQTEELTLNLASEKKQTLEETANAILQSAQIEHQNVHQTLAEINKSFENFHEKSIFLSTKVEERRHLEEKITKLLDLFGNEESELFKALNQLEAVHLKHTQEVEALQSQISALLILNQEKEQIIEKLTIPEIQAQNTPGYCYI